MSVVRKDLGWRPAPWRLLVFATLLVAASSDATAACSDEDLLLAGELAEQAAQSSDDSVRLQLLKRSANTCTAYPVWLDLGELQMQMGQPFDAVYAFEHAVDFQPIGSEGITPDQLLRRAIANARLAEAYHASGELAMAMVATQEAVDAFDLLEVPVPRRLVNLQAKLDDAVSQADSDVMVRSIEVQQDRASRGIAVSPQLLTAVEELATVNETLSLLANFSGDPVATPAELGLPVAEPAASVEKPPVIAQDPAQVDAKQAPEARINIPVLFQFDSATLTPESHATIEQLADALLRLQLGPESTVMVIGHTDTRGSAAYNLQLSLARAQAVATVLETYLQKQSITDIKIEFQGRGATELRYTGMKAADHRRNRRVEVVVK